MIILISAANADVCLSMARIIKTHEFYKSARVIGLTPGNPWPAQQNFDEVLTIPMAHEPDYADALIEIVSNIKPDVFIPFSEAELSWFHKNLEFIQRLNTHVIINPPEVLNVFLDKKDTADYLKNLGLSVPRTSGPEDIGMNDLPVIMKPRRSAGSKNMAILRNQFQLEGFREQYKSDLGNFVAQEFIDVNDAEFTCGVWRGGEKLRYCTFRRQLQGGMTGVAKVEQRPTIDQALEKISASIQGDFFVNVQLRLRNDVPYIFEINPRFSSTVMMRHKIGFEDFIWTLDQHYQRSNVPDWKAPLGTIIYRLSEECVVNAEGKRT